MEKGFSLLEVLFSLSITLLIALLTVVIIAIAVVQAERFPRDLLRRLLTGQKSNVCY